MSIRTWSNKICITGDPLNLLPILRITDLSVKNLVWSFWVAEHLNKNDEKKDESI